ncbi:MAG: hypothetical protein ACNA8L_10300 [Luteolibacter sp.]
MARRLDDRTDLHANMAGRAEDFTRDYILGNQTHATATRLGAKPTGHWEKSAKLIYSRSDGEKATVGIPRSTGLGRAFADVTIRPKAGRKFLTVPGHPDTYGKAVADFAEGTFRFAILYAHRPFPVLLFAKGANEGRVAYWLRKEVSQRQDRTLLPSRGDYAAVALRAAREWLSEAERGDTA